MITLFQNIQNNMDNSVIVSFTGAQISGIKEGKEAPMYPSLNELFE